MTAFKLSGLVILVLLQLAFGQELQQLVEEGSGSVGESVTPSLVDDYVNCPPDDGGNDDDSEDATETVEDYAYDYDAPQLMPSEPHRCIHDEIEDLEGESSIVEVVNGDLQDEPSVEEDGEDASTEEVIDVGGDEEASGDAEDVSSSIQLIKAPKIYNVPDTESLDNKFAAFTEEHPEEIVLTSPNYPEPYPNSVNSFEDYTVTGGIGVQITIHDIDLDPESDFLFIRGGPVTDEGENGPVLTGKITPPVRFLIPHTTTFSIHFVSQHDETAVQAHKGFRLTYAPFGTVVSPTTPTTTEMIVPREELQWIRKEVAISRNMMVSIDTWPLVKTALANASNTFVELHQLKYQPCRPDDIRILAQKCPDTWPGYEECVSLEFAVPLRPIVVIEEESEGSPHGLEGKRRLREGKGFISLTTTEEPEVEYQLAKGNLEQMWIEFGAMALAEVGIEVYKMPENASVLMIWIAISLCIVAAFIFVLYSIWKIDFFKDYRRISKLSRETQDEDRSELKKKEYDISMFPSPHQVVPTLFPNGDPYSERPTEAQYAYDNSTMNPWADDMDDPAKFNGNPAPPRNHQPKQQVFEPLSPLDYSPSIVDFNEIPEPRSPRRSRVNPFLPPSNGGSPGGRGGGGQ